MIPNLSQLREVIPITSDELRELTSIKRLLILQLLKSGATSDEIDMATDMGASNIRGLFPKVKKKDK
jgi:hypothetical protein